MLSPELMHALRSFAVTFSLDDVRKPGEGRDSFRTDLSDSDFADWFLEGKIENGRVVSEHALNDFVIFRVAHDWPQGAFNWVLDVEDIVSADFSLTTIQAADLVEMAREGLSDGHVSADWFAKVAIVWMASKRMEIPDPLFEYLQQTLFLPPKLARKAAVGGKNGSGRSRADGVDRDRVIRNLVDGLSFRNLMHPARATHVRAIAVQALGRRKVGLTEDAVRKICERAKRSEREMRLWELLVPSSPPESFP